MTFIRKVIAETNTFLALERASARDLEKGGIGWMSAPEVARRADVSVSTARRHLLAMSRSNQVEHVVEGRTSLFRPAAEAEGLRP